VPQSSRTLKSSTRISHTHNGSKKVYVRKKRALRSQICYWNDQESYLTRVERVFITYTPKTNNWEDSAYLSVRPQCNSWSDHQGGNGYNFKKIDRWRCWRSDRPRIEVGGVTGPWWRSDRHGLLRLPKNQVYKNCFSKVFNDSNLHGPRRRTVVLTQNSHKNIELKQSGNYRLIK
jgi:hypothetical protein